MHYSEKNLPFGGVGESGMGAYHGKERENRVQSGRFEQLKVDGHTKDPKDEKSRPSKMKNI